MKLVKDLFTGKCKGFGFLDMEGHEARAAIAGSLLDSLDQPPDPDAEAAWEAEVEKRVRELDDQAVAPVPWSAARRAIVGGE